MQCCRTTQQQLCSASLATGLITSLKYRTVACNALFLKRVIQREHTRGQVQPMKHSQCSVRCTALARSLHASRALNDTIAANAKTLLAKLSRFMPGWTYA